MEQKQIENLTNKMCIKTAIKRINRLINAIKEINCLTALARTNDTAAHYVAIHRQHTLVVWCTIIPTTKRTGTQLHGSTMVPLPGLQI